MPYRRYHDAAFSVFTLTLCRISHYRRRLPRYLQRPRRLFAIGGEF